MLFFQEGFGDVFSGRRGVNPAFFIADGPHKHAGPAAVAFQQANELIHVFRAAVEQPRFVHDQHTEAVAGIQQFRRRRIGLAR